MSTYSLSRPRPCKSTISITIFYFHSKKENIYLGPTRALKSLISSRSLLLTALLFTNCFPPFSSVIDTHIRDSLIKLLTLYGHGFHTFRRSGATLAFDHNVPVQNTMTFGAAQLFGHTFKIHLNLHPSLLTLFLAIFLSISSLRLGEHFTNFSFKIFYWSGF